MQAQLIIKLKDKVNRSAKNLTTKVKAEIVPDRIIDHIATKVGDKAESIIGNREQKANKGS